MRKIDFLGNSGTKVSLSLAIFKRLDKEKTTFQLKAKTGRMESGTRKEILISFKRTELKQILAFLELFEIKTGCLRFYHRYDFQYGQYFISLKENGFAPDHFEIETTAKNQEAVGKEGQKIQVLLNSLGLKAYSEEEYKEIMLSTFRRYPPVPFSEIDFSTV